MRLFKIYDYKGGKLARKILGFPLIHKNHISTLLFFNLPIFQKRKSFTQKPMGGGVKRDYVYRFCGFPLYKTFRYKRIERSTAFALHQNYLLAPGFLKMSDSEIFEKTQKLCDKMDSQSQQIIFRIISRTRAAAISPSGKVFHLTQCEKDALCHIDSEYLANICEITPEIFYYQGYFLPVPYCEISVFLYKHGLDTFSPKTLEKIKNLDVVDVGGFMGDSALIFQNFTDKNIYSFEATSHNHNLMLQTIQLNNAKRIVPVKKALGSQESKMTISLCGSASSLLKEGILHRPAKQEEVEIITLDSYVNEHKLKIGLIKVDIEGFEMEFLKGAKQTICEQKPTMIISIYHQASDFFDIKPLLESWNLGYKFHIYKPLDHSISLETTLMCEIID